LVNSKADADSSSMVDVISAAAVATTNSRDIKKSTFRQLLQ
jgi:hypothetical protein